MCVILLQGQRKLFFVSPTSSRKRQSKLDKTRKTLNNQMAPRGCGRQQVWTYAGWEVFWGWGGGYHTGGGGGQGWCLAGELVARGQGEPTLFFFLWSSSESLSSASSACRSEACFSFSDNLGRKKERKPHGRPIITRDNVFLGNMSPGNEQCYSQSKKLWTRHCCVGLLVGEERE